MEIVPFCRRIGPWKAREPVFSGGSRPVFWYSWFRIRDKTTRKPPANCAKFPAEDGENHTLLKVIVLNKVDLMPEETRDQQLDVLTRKLKNTFAKTSFKNNVFFCRTSAFANIGLENLIGTIKENLTVPRRDDKALFLLSYDHAFPIKGQGTVVTGTILSGSVKPGQVVDVPQLGQNGKGKKVRSLQMFHKPAKVARQGDRVAMCVPQIDAGQLERGIVVDPKYPLPTMHGVEVWPLRMVFVSILPSKCLSSCGDSRLYSGEVQKS